MGHIENRGEHRWRARFRGPDGKERSRTFTKKPLAEKWLAVQSGAVAKGDWVDPAGARTKVSTYAKDWRAGLGGRESSLEQVDSHLRARILPKWGERTIGSITRAEVQGWINDMVKAETSPAYVEGIYRRFSSMMLGAVEDRLIGLTPCRRIALPEKPHEQVQPLPEVTVAALTGAMPPRARATVVLAAGSGLRQGEVLGLTIDRIDWLRRQIRVDRQMVTLRGQGAVFGPPKTKASVRTVPVPQNLLDVLAAHLAEFPAGEDQLLFTMTSGQPWRRPRFGEIFTSAKKDAEVGGDVVFHDLRHFYASVLIEAGEGAHVIKERLGHSSITETFDTYGHLFPPADDRTRDAISGVLDRVAAVGRGQAAEAASGREVRRVSAMPSEAGRGSKTTGGLGI